MKLQKKKKMPIFSPLYKHFVKDDLALSAAYPIYNKSGTLQGVLGTHIILSSLNQYLNDIVKIITELPILLKETQEI